MKHDIKSMLPEEIEVMTASMGLPKYRAAQIFGWVQSGADSFDDMTNLPKGLRERLKESFVIPSATIVKKQISAVDGTVKYLFRLDDGHCIESVFMRYSHGNTVCVSTQAGCRMGCFFCASAIGGLKRNLAASEMLAQVSSAAADTGERVSGVVLMGIGEPLDNYDNVLRFIKLINNGRGMNIGQRHISLSTCGIIENIRKLAREGLQITLSVSLHAPNDAIRRALMPIASKYKVDDLLAVCLDYEKETGRRVSFEYALISGLNDGPDQADELGKKLKGTLCHVNLIPVNEIREREYKRTGKAAAEAFVKRLEGYGVTATVRRRLGGDISAACGQLRRNQESGDRNQETRDCEGEGLKINCFKNERS